MVLLPFPYDGEDLFPHALEYTRVNGKQAAKQSNMSTFAHYILEENLHSP